VRVEWVVGAKLGLQLFPGKTRVKQILREGLLYEWNEAHPSDAVAPGMRLAKVNGCACDEKIVRDQLGTRKPASSSFVLSVNAADKGHLPAKPASLFQTPCRRGSSVRLGRSVPAPTAPPDLGSRSARKTVERGCR